MIAFPICYIALASKSGSSSAGNLEQLSNSRLHPSLHHPSIPSAQPSCLAVPLSAQFGPSPKYKPTSRPQLAAQGQAEKKHSTHSTAPHHAHAPPTLLCLVCFTDWLGDFFLKKEAQSPTYLHPYLHTYLPYLGTLTLVFPLKSPSSPLSSSNHRPHALFSLSLSRLSLRPTARKKRPAHYPPGLNRIHCPLLAPRPRSPDVPCSLIQQPSIIQSP